MCFDLNPESGTQLCLKAATVSLSSNHTEHLPPQPARLRFWSKSRQHLQPLTRRRAENGLEKIKHHHDPKGRHLKKPTPMSSNYVFMKEAHTEQNGKSSETSALDWLWKVRDITITVDVLSDSESVQLFPI